ncbi:acetyl/propionyl/methylcrotonyl-CoA carboxylase subunit alpha [Nocardia nova]|uniref:acetyl/propionyl/methylcrotonyl-CoA carboxylase subunit alpha n=1 Tax=Nocardia nova TaxID=37330 RepID=UPI000CEA3534|nr:biotin carboxylase N-terminal domain-containing protein [Nocardia nova]PPI93241.1 acetyl/propionyl-CoA carboxylase subunit alpha [Nocardia nova]
MIHKLLIANRAEIAERVIRTARDMDIATVAVYSDADAAAPFVTLADEAVALPGSAPADTYLRGDLIIRAAQRTGADAIHPGYGFLSENAEFARSCAEAGIVFVGPPPEAIETMGSKTAAKELMAAAGVPVLNGLVVDSDGTVGRRPLLEAAAALELPLLVKASYGGGGRGMRIVRELGSLPEAVERAQSEAASAFGNGAVFLEHYVERPRHIEVQVFADDHGNTVHLFERECSIQRRYQKIIEEAPSSAVDESLRDKLGSAAVDAARAIGYRGAGTVEFVMDPAGDFYFLEVNTRLQVEHPVTEAVTGTDLVRAQLLVAEGKPLPPEVLSPTLRGHAVEVRLYAEDVAAGYLPSTGTVHRFEVPDLPGIRVDSGIRSGSRVGVHYDPMLAKVIAHGADREQAVRRLGRALAETVVHGVTTNRQLLVSILREPEFRAGAIDTGYLDRHDHVAMSRSNDPRAEVVHLIAAALIGAARRRGGAGILPQLPAGWRNVPSSAAWAAFRTDDDAEHRIAYDLRRGVVTVDDDEHTVVVHDCDCGRIDLSVDGVRTVVRSSRVADTEYVDSGLGSSTLIESPRFTDPADTQEAGSLLAPMHATVIRTAVDVGDPVAAGAVVVVLEAMKMEHTVTAPHDGLVTSLPIEVGSTVEGGAVLAVIEEKGH